MILNRLLGGLAVAVLIAMVPAGARASSLCDGITGNLIQNCGFEILPAGGGNVPPNWVAAQFTDFEAIVGGQVNSGNEAMQIANDEFQDGEPLFNGSAILSQSFTDDPGATYQFTFYLFNSAGSSNTFQQLFNAYWGSTSGTPVFTDTGGGNPAVGYTQETASVIGTGADSITFTSYNTPAYYYLDDVSVVETSSSSTPEPASALLLMLGIAGFAGVTRLRKKA